MCLIVLCYAFPEAPSYPNLSNPAQIRVEAKSAGKVPPSLFWMTCVCVRVRVCVTMCTWLCTYVYVRTYLEQNTLETDIHNTYDNTFVEVINRVSAFQGEVYFNRIGPIIGTFEYVHIIEGCLLHFTYVYLLYHDSAHVPIPSLPLSVTSTSSLSDNIERALLEERQPRKEFH